jgi:hypothetical protein
MSRCLLAGVLVALVVVVAAVPMAPAWWSGGHATVAEAAAMQLPDNVPTFFRAGGKSLAHYSGDPDRWKNPAAKHLRASESPDHFIDLENFQGKELPPDRFKAIALLIELKEDPAKVGFLPWAICENYDRLSCAFYDYRQDPDSQAIRAKCLVYAGILSHLTGDLSMPLHNTINYDGKKGPDGKMVQRGIHAKLDAFPEKNGFTPEEVCRGLKPKQIDDAWAHVLECIKESRSHIDRSYELDAAGAFEKPTAESRTFVMERCRFGAQLTADLWYSAWVRSARMPPHY